MKSRSFSKVLMYVFVVFSLIILNKTDLKAHNYGDEVCQGMEVVGGGATVNMTGECSHRASPNFVDILFVPSGYNESEGDQFYYMAGRIAQGLMMKEPFKDPEYEDLFRFSTLNPDHVNVESVKVRGSNYPIPNITSFNQMREEHRYPANITVVLVKRAGGEFSCGHGISFNKELLGRRKSNSADDEYIDENNGKGIYENISGLNISDDDWRRVWALLDAGAGIAVVGVDESSTICQNQLDRGEGPNYNPGNYGREFKITSTAIHEIAHALAGLEDEYSSSGPGFRLDLNREGYKAPNVAEVSFNERANRDSYPWEHLISDETPLPTPFDNTLIINPTVGAFEGAAYQTSGVFRPQQNCAMRDHDGNHSFCVVCQEAIRVKLCEKYRADHSSLNNECQPLSLIAYQNTQLNVDNQNRLNSGTTIRDRINNDLLNSLGNRKIDKDLKIPSNKKIELPSK